MGDKFEVARLDENGIIISVDVVNEAGYRTDAVSRTVRLEAGHDMRNRIRSYRWNFNRNQFEPISTEPIDVAERDTSELVEALVETLEDITSHLGNASDLRKMAGVAEPKAFTTSRRWDRVIKEYRRYNPRKDKAAGA